MGLIEKVRNMALQTGRGSNRNSYEYDEYDEEYDDYEEELQPVYQPASRAERDRSSRSPEPKSVNNRSTVLSIHTNVQMQVIIAYPESIEEAGSICDHVRANKTVVVNLENVKHETAQRVIDFLGGVSYALEGDIQYISNKIFLVAPKNVDITGHFKEELKANGILFNFR